MSTLAASVVDSQVFSDLFAARAMREIFSDRARTQRYLDVELALARVQARLGIIPAAAAEIQRHGNAADYDMDKVAAGTVKAGTPIACRSPEEGIRRAERALAGGSILGAQVVRVTHDDDAGEFGEPEFLGKFGRVPDAD